MSFEASFNKKPSPSEVFDSESKKLYECNQVEPGTALNLLINLKNQIEKNKEVLDRGGLDENREKINRKLILQKMLLARAILSPDLGGKILIELADKGGPNDIKTVEEERKKYSAIKMYDIIESSLEHWEKLQDNGWEKIDFPETSNIGINIKFLIDSTKDLQMRLLDEGRNLEK